MTLLSDGLQRNLKRVLQIREYQRFTVGIEVDQCQHTVEHARPSVGIKVRFIRLGVADRTVGLVCFTRFSQTGLMSFSMASFSSTLSR